MKKRFFTVVMATVMTLAMSVSAFAAELADVDATGWWVAHSTAIEVDETGVEVNFTATTYESATSNWNSPLYVVYTATEEFAGGAGISDVAGYTEYAVVRSDTYAWSGEANTGNLDSWTNKGFTWEATAPADWTTWLESLKGGVDGTLEAQLSGDTLTAVFTVGDAVSTASFKVDSSKPVYISLTGELCKLTNINIESVATEVETEAEETEDTTTTAEVTEESPKTGDASSVAFVTVVLFAAAGTLILLKKRTVNE